MGAIPEPDAVVPPAHPDTVTWIARDRPVLDRLTPDGVIATATPPATLPSRAPAGAPRRWLTWGLAAVLLVGVGLWSALHNRPKLVPLADQQNIPVISVMKPGVKAVTTSVTFTGAIAARYDMPIGNDGDTGRIVGVYVEAGDHVRRGQLLARLDDSVLVPQVNRLAAALEQAKAQAALSAAVYRRALGVASAGALSAEEIERRRATSVTDAASVKVVMAQLAEIQARLNRTRIVAPFAGTVLTRKAEVGQIASPGGEALFRVASGGEVEMRGQLVEQDLAQVKVGDPASIYLTGLPQAFPGRVRLLGAIIDPQSRLGEIRITLQPDPALRPGAFARGTVAVSKALRPVVPQTAVLADANGSYVFIVNAQGKAQRRVVRVADTSDDGVIIASGLTGSERVVSTAGGFLRDGEPVKAIAAAGASPTSPADARTMAPAASAPPGS